MSELLEFGERIRGPKFFERCTPVVCIGGPPILAKPPNKSVRPPNADKLDSAFNAPGFANNCAKGMADAKGLLVVEDDDDAVRVDEPDWLPLFVDEWLDSWRFAFWSSTL